MGGGPDRIGSAAFFSGRGDQARSRGVDRIRDGSRGVARQAALGAGMSMFCSCHRRSDRGLRMAVQRVRVDRRAAAEHLPPSRRGLHLELRHDRRAPPQGHLPLHSRWHHRRRAQRGIPAPVDRQRRHSRGEGRATVGLSSGVDVSHGFVARDASDGRSQSSRRRFFVDRRGPTCLGFTRRTTCNGCAD